LTAARIAVNTAIFPTRKLANNSHLILMTKILDIIKASKLKKYRLPNGRPNISKLARDFGNIRRQTVQKYFKREREKGGEKK